MKKSLPLILLLFLLSTVVFAQDVKKYETYLSQEISPVAKKYTDPYYPSERFVAGVKNDRMEEYAKLHPPIPRTPNAEMTDADQSRLEQAQSEWLAQNPYYPQFVPYHLYNYLLTPEDDVAIYEAALAVWSKANPDKAAEIQAADIK